MKKILLSALTLALGFGAYSQEACEIGNFLSPGITDADTMTTPPAGGISSLIFWDDFATETEYANVDAEDNVTAGMFWFAADADQNPGFEAVITRNAAEGNQNVVVTQAEAGFAPIGFGLGDDLSFDLSENLNYSFTVTNNDADATIRVRMGLQDTEGRVAGNGPGATDAAPFNDQIEIVLAPGETGTLEGTFEGSGRAVFGDAATCMSADGTEGPNCFIEDIDFTQIGTVLFTIINDEVNEDFVPLAIDEVSVTFDEVIIGFDCVTGIRNNAEELETVSIFPNPASSVVNFSEELETVTIMNTLGNVVFTGTDVNSVNVSSFEAGIYSVISNKGSRTFIVE